MAIATKTYIKKSIERLYGIIEGVSVDCTVNDEEIAALNKWLNTHEYLNCVEPFKGLDALLQDILSDGVIDADEREELVEWCADTINEQGFLDEFTDIVRRLHGIFSGIMCDSIIRKEELEGLKDWLLDYEQFSGWWPFNELGKIIHNILEDGQIDKKEHEMLSIFFNDFAEQILPDPVIHDEEYWMENFRTSPSPIFKSISSICENDPDICFEGKCFCFTGPAATGVRADLVGVVYDLGGWAKNNVGGALDYLVVGAQSSPAWVYSTYGRKIETVMNQKENAKARAQIISENDFVNAAKKAGWDGII
jgi:hypothetical protein